MKRPGWGGAGRKLTPKLKLNSHLISPVNAKGQEVKVFRQYKVSNFVFISFTCFACPDSGYVGLGSNR